MNTYNKMFIWHQWTGAKFLTSSQ